MLFKSLEMYMSMRGNRLDGYILDLVELINRVSHGRVFLAPPQRGVVIACGILF